MKTSILFTLLVVVFSFTSFSFGQAPEPKVRVLIFSAPFGSGHNTAAARIAETIVENYEAKGLQAEVVIKNSLDFTPKFYTDIALKQFASVQTNAPIVYSYLFEKYLHKAEKVDNAGQMTLFKQLLLSVKEMDKFIVEGAFKNSAGQPVPPDVIFSTWPGSTEALINLRHSPKSQLMLASPAIPLAHVQTDNAADDKYFQLFAQDVSGKNGADVVYVPSKEVYTVYADKLGFKNVVLTGMPLKLKGALPSYEERDKDKIAARKALGIPENQRTLMIEAGKNGAANYSVIVGSLLHFNTGEPINIIAACGENKKNEKLLGYLVKGAKKGTPEFKALFSEMKELYQPKTVRNFLKKGSRIFGLQPAMTKENVIKLIETGVGTQAKLTIKGFGQLQPLRAASDIVITKPGGLSTAELGTDGRPMIVLQEYASGEALPNGPLFEKKGLSITNNDISVIGVQALSLLSDPSKTRQMYDASAVFRTEFYLDRVLPFVDKAAETKSLGAPISCEKLF